MKVIRSDVNGVTLAFEFAEPVFRDAPGADANAKGGHGSQPLQVDLAGCTRSAEPGFPDLPQRQVMCGVAQQGAIRISVSDEEFRELGDCEIAPVVSYGGEGREVVQEYVRGGVYTEDRWQPAELVSLVGIAMLRDIRVAQLLISPVRYNPVQRRLRYYRHVMVDVRFAEPARDRSSFIVHRSSFPKDDPFAKLYPVMLVNGAVAQDWKVETQDRSSFNVHRSSFPEGSFFDHAAVWLKIKIESAGAYRIGYDDLVRTGVNPEFIDPRTFQLFTVGAHVPNSLYADTMNEIALFVSGEEDSVFDRTDQLLFYARAISDRDTSGRKFVTNPYSRYNVYWLTWGAARGKRMMQGLGTPLAGDPRRNTGLGQEHLEQDQECPVRSGLLWIWNMMDKSGGTPRLRTDYDAALAHPRYLTKLSGQFYSTTTDNRMNVRLNDQLLDSFSFGINSYLDPFRFELTWDALPADSTRNTLALELAGNNGMKVFLDWFEISYVKRLRLNQQGALDFFVAESSAQTFSVSGVQGEPIVLNLDHPEAPNVITGWVHQGDSVVFRDVVSDTSWYLVTDQSHLRPVLSIERRTPGRLRTLAADYVIIAPEQLYDVAQVLQHYRTNNVPGLHAAVARTVRLSEIYDDFAFGRPEPVAIKEFFRTVRPAYGLLLGDATYDYRDMLNLHPQPGVPPYEEGYSADPSGYSSASRATDCWYADFDGAGSTPDMFLGRVTVRTPNECRQFIQKLIAYEQGQYGSWCTRGIAAADDEWLGYPPGYDRIGLDHIRASETIAALWGDAFNVAKVYLTEYPFVAYGDKPGARNELIRQFKRGALLFCYFGHGAGEALSHENLLNVQLVPQLINEGRAPVCMFASCAVGRWEDTRFECIAEEMARTPNGGAIAAVGASKATQPSSNLEFARTMFRMLLDTTRPSLGQAFAAALPALTLYHLFGDPATRLAIPDPCRNPLFVNDTLQPGRTYPFSASIPFTRGYAAASLFGSLWLRTYNSPAPISNPSVTYILPGDEFYRGAARIAEGMLSGRFVVPTGTRRGTRLVADGSYIEIARSARLDAMAWAGQQFLSLQKKGLVLDTVTALNQDHTGPQITLYADGRRLSVNDTTQVPSSFTLTGRLSDSSGILISSIPSGDAFYLYVSDYKNRVALTDWFSYDLGSCTSGSFSYPVNLTGVIDSIAVVAADNFGNRSGIRVLVRTQTETELAIREPLVYPNPVKDQGSFTFQLSAPASVTIKVFTLSGRLLRVLERPDAQSGFNYLAWDGRDRQNSPLPNGVYLYAITARSFDGQTRPAEEAIVRDRFVIRR